jgi:two-component sensor histidine kinase
MQQQRQIYCHRRPVFGEFSPFRRAASGFAAFLAAVLPLGQAAFGAEAVEPAGPMLATPTNALYVMHPQYEVGHWIWADRTSDQQTCRFWKSFVVPRSGRVTQARLRIAVDNSYRLFLDGREIGKGGEWRSLNEYDVTEVLGPGAHTLAVEGFSDYAAAGLVCGLRVQFADGQTLEVPSDATWRIIPNDEKHWETRRNAEPHWPAATVIAPYLGGPWKQASARVIQVPPVQRIVVKFWQTAWFQITLLSVCGAAILVCVYLMSQLASQSKAQQFLQRERARIARDIHDDVGARLTQLVLLGERAQSELPPETRTRAQFDQMCESTRAILGAIDEVLWTVNSRRDTVQDFETYVCNYAESFLLSTHIRCRLDVATEVPEGAFDLAIRRNLFLAIKEALNNAAKHSGATELFLRIQPTEKEIVVVVEDNGKGFEPAQADRVRNGLTNMTQRIAEVGGRCRISSQPGRGCRVEFSTPLVHAPRSRLRWWRGFSSEPTSANAPNGAPGGGSLKT